MKRISIFIVLGFFYSCAAFQYRANYVVNLIETERPKEASERYGEPKITKIEEEGIWKYSFEDEMIQIIWLPLSDYFSFLLKNKTEHSIKIVWDEAAFVNENGASYRVIHSGIKYSEKEKPQLPSVIVRKGTLSDLIVPADNIDYVYDDWQRKPLLPNYIQGKEPNKLAQLKEASQEYIGKNFQILLPLKIEDIVNEYIFTFKIEDAEFGLYKMNFKTLEYAIKDGVEKAPSKKREEKVQQEQKQKPKIGRRQLVIGGIFAIAIIFVGIFSEGF